MASSVERMGILRELDDLARNARSEPQYNDAIILLASEFLGTQPYCDYHDSRGLAFWRKGEYSRAFEDLSAALALNPNCPHATSHKAELLYLFGQDDSAEQLYQRLFGLMEKNPKIHEEYKYRALVFLGDIALGRNKRQEALTFCAQVPSESEYYADAQDLIEKINRIRQLPAMTEHCDRYISPHARPAMIEWSGGYLSDPSAKLVNPFTL